MVLDFRSGRTIAPDPTGEHFIGSVQARTGECGAGEHTPRGYDESPDYEAFWTERDYLTDIAKFRVPVLVGGGWRDFNVKPDESINLYNALPVDDQPPRRSRASRSRCSTWARTPTATRTSGDDFRALQHPSAETDWLWYLGRRRYTTAPTGCRPCAPADRRRARGPCRAVHQLGGQPPSGTCSSRNSRTARV